MTTLNLGCGNKQVPGAVNLDVTSKTNPDVVHDLRIRPWPFANDTFDRVLANDVLEHLPDLVKSMEEIHRITRAGGTVHITVPHFSSRNAFADPTHLRFFSVMTLDYFSQHHELGFYSDARFEIVKKQIVFHPSLLNKLVSRLANRRADSYEHRWTWLFPAWFLSFELPGSQSLR